MGVAVAFLDWDGKPLGQLVPMGSLEYLPLQIKQMEVSRDPKRAAAVARKIVQAKLDSEGAGVRVPDLDVRGLRGVESKYAELYFARYREEVLSRWPNSHFKLRGHPNHGCKMRAIDPVNALLNFGYHLLEIRARVLLSRLGLSPYFGFLHATVPSKEAAVYDVQEFERVTIDRAILMAIEDSDVRKAASFSRNGDDWVVRLNQAPIRAVIKTVDEAFARRVESGTVEGRFYREAKQLRSWIAGA